MIFDYPTAVHVRRHGPRGYKEYQAFKPWLRDEFIFRSVYCLLRERWFPPFFAALFSVDHVAPQSLSPALECVYENLVYACVACNARKRDAWPFLDPCAEPLSEHLRIRQDGGIDGLTAAGRRMIKILQLDRDELTRFRRELLELEHIALNHPRSQTTQRFRELLSFPDDLPDLGSLRPPEGNGRFEGVRQSYFERRRGGTPLESY
jgi:hypothetical protein